LCSFNYVRPNRDRVIRDHEDQEICYLRLIFSLAQNDKWHQRLARDGYIEQCISQGGEPLRWSPAFYLVEIFIHISGDLPSRPFQERWRQLIG
jgi:hypothetical protein